MKFFNRQPDDVTLDNEASELLLELEDPQPDTQDRFVAWLHRSPRHVKAMDAIARMYFALDDKLDPQCRIDVQALLAQTDSNIVPIRAGTSSDAMARTTEPDPPRTGRRLWLIACTLAIAVAIGWLVGANLALGSRTYVTGVGEQRELKLDDGSIVTLNTRSRVQVNFSETVRDIRLLEGEALFSVAHDKTRPFRVVAGDSTIQAIGTQFKVYRHSGGTTVAVVEGIVQILRNEQVGSSSALSGGSASQAMTASVAVPSIRLSAGEVAEVMAAGQVVKSEMPDMEKEIAWKKRRELVFTDDTLDYVAEQFNRYNHQQIQLQDDVVRGRRITGIFSADHPQSLTLFLATDPALHVERQGDTVVVRTN